MRNRSPVRIILGFLSLMCLPASAIVFYSTGDVSYNTTAPAGPLEGSGWQLQGRFNQYLGTPVGPHHFLAAKHIGGSVGNKFYYNGKVFTTIGSVADAENDLRLWEVSERFSSYAPLYSATDEVGKGLVVFGRGLDRGGVVTNTLTTRVKGQFVTEVITNGWEWGTRNYIQRWGTNVVSGTEIVNGYPVLKVDWDADAGDDECMLADKDSSGGVFIQDNGVWKLAGMNYAIGPTWTYSFNSDGSDPFNASILDFRGDDPLYIENGTNWYPTSAFSITKSSFYVSRISSSYSWITNNVTDFDQDVDLIPDWWEQQYSVSVTGMTASGDDDDDGFTNLNEYIADTHPADSNSFWQVDGVFTLTNQTFTFDGSTARQYQVSCTTNDLTDPGLIWVTNGLPIWGTGEGTQITITNQLDKTITCRIWVTLP